jgi:anti-sigma factor RsiW
METGIHELTAGYAMDALEPEERQAYEGHLADCERCQHDLASFWDVTTSLALAVTGPEPDPGLRDRILNQAKSERQNVVPLRFRRVTQTRVAAAIAAVAAVAAIALGAWAVSLHNQLDDTRAALDAQRGTGGILADPRAQTVGLAAGSGKLVVSSGGVAVIVLDGLSSAPAGKTYELWVIQGKTPTRAGLFRGGGRVVVRIERPVPTGAIVAVTLERAGGVNAPTGTPLAASRPV